MKYMDMRHLENGRRFQAWTENVLNNAKLNLSVPMKGPFT
ncbi:hypothetical protein YQE_06451, partial [Dendroctonus ponderosae]